jgi:Flp pilus assembly protein TadB
MKKKTPSNPLPTAESLNLSLNAGTAQQPPSQKNTEPGRPSKHKARRKSTHARRPGSKASRADSENRWNRIKARLAAKVAQVDQEKLHEVLLGCGVAVGIVASVVLAIKLLPLATLILAFLGLALALRLWGLLPLPRPC